MDTTVFCNHAFSLEEQVKNSFRRAGLCTEYARAMKTRAAALDLAGRYGLDKAQVSAAALLHNISRLVPEKEYIGLAEEYGLEILPEERQQPQLLHQKISRILAVEQFNVSDKEVLNAVSCHTTLRQSASLLDKIIFLAAKQNNEQLKKLAFNDNKKVRSEQELNKSVFSCLFNEINNKNITLTVHPWAKQALEELKQKL